MPEPAVGDDLATDRPLATNDMAGFGVPVRSDPAASPGVCATASTKLRSTSRPPLGRTLHRDTEDRKEPHLSAPAGVRSNGRRWNLSAGNTSAHKHPIAYDLV
jgi:hypothetical protein